MFTPFDLSQGPLEIERETPFHIRQLIFALYIGTKNDMHRLLAQEIPPQWYNWLAGILADEKMQSGALIPWVRKIPGTLPVGGLPNPELARRVKAGIGCLGKMLCAVYSVWSKTAVCSEAEYLAGTGPQPDFSGMEELLQTTVNIVRWQRKQL